MIDCCTDTKGKIYRGGRTSVRLAPFRFGGFQLVQCIATVGTGLSHI